MGTRLSLLVREFASSHKGDSPSDFLVDGDVGRFCMKNRRCRCIAIRDVVDIDTIYQGVGPVRANAYVKCTVDKHLVSVFELPALSFPLPAACWK
jgi:hypothetical protein